MGHRLSTKSGLKLDLVQAIHCKSTCDAHAEFCTAHRLFFWDLSVAGGDDAVEVISTAQETLHTVTATLPLGVLFKEDLATLLERHYQECNL